MEQLGHNKKGRIGKMTKRMSLTWLVLILMTAATAAAQTLDAAAFSLIPPSGVGPGQFTNGNGDAAAFSTVDNEIDSWWGLGIKSPCCSNYSGYGIVFDARSGSIYTQGNIGIGTASPISALTLAGGGNPNPNTGPQINYPGENLTFVNNSLNGNFELGGIRMVQPAGYYYDRGNMVFTLGVGSGATFDAVTIQSPTGNVGIGTTAPGATLEVNGRPRLTAH